MAVSSNSVTCSTYFPCRATPSHPIVCNSQSRDTDPVSLEKRKQKLRDLMAEEKQVATTCVYVLSERNLTLFAPSV